LFAKKKQKSNKQRFDASVKKSKVNLSRKDTKNNNVFDNEISRLSRISRTFCRRQQSLKDITSNASQEISSRNIVLLFNNKKRKKLTYLNNCDLNTINVAQRIFNFNFDILRNTRKRKREKETKRETTLLFALRNS